jgi:Flp pilus assembly protein TadD
MSGLAASSMQLAVQAHRQGDLQAAIRLYRTALAAAPRDTDALNLLGTALAQAGDAAAGEKSIRQALAIRPRTAPYLVNLGSALVAQRRFAEAAASFRQATRLQPNYPQAWSNLGNALREENELDAAEDSCRRAVRLDANFAEAQANLGSVLRQLGRAGEALACYQQALRMMPGNATLLFNVGGALVDLGRVGEAERHAREAFRLAPHDAQVRHGLALICLLTGREAEGWAHFEARLGLPGRRMPDFGVPAWTGEPLSAPVLLHAEEGLGDTIQFCRFAAAASERSRVMLLVPDALATLFATLAGPQAIVTTRRSAGDIGAHLPLMSLPHVLGLPSTTLADTVPYLHADPTRRALWRARLDGLARPRVGVAWAGNPKYPRDRGRSIPFPVLAPLLAVPGPSFVSLQKGTNPPQSAPLHDWTADFADFADTAALIAELDLVIAVDTAVAHLAGALGQPVWLLNRFDTDWRWGRDTDRSRWYPSLRQFRQPAPGDWASTIAAMAARLARAFSA